MSFIAINNQSGSIGGGGSTVTIGENTGVLLDKCEVCYDPEKDNKCGEDAVIDIKKSNTEKTGPLESSILLEAVPYNTPSNIASDVYTWTTFMPHALANLTNVGITSGKLLDLVPIGQFGVGAKSLNITKVGTTLYRFFFKFDNFQDHYDFQDYLFGSTATEFFSIARVQDIHLWGTAITNTVEDDVNFTWEVIYDTSILPSNVNQKFWALYTVLRLNNLALLNNTFAQAYTSSGAIKYWHSGAPVQKVQVERVITFSNTCPPKTILKTIELESVSINPSLKAGTINLFDGLLLTYKIT